MSQIKEYEERIKQLEDRIHQLKQVGWYAIIGWEWTINNKDRTFADNPYNWHTARSIFSKDEPIDNKTKDIIDTRFFKGDF